MNKPVNIGCVVLHRDQPLLALAPRREEDAAVVLIEPVRVTIGIVDAQEVTEIADRLRGEYHSALGARGHDVRAEPVSRYLCLQALGGTAR